MSLRFVFRNVEPSRHVREFGRRCLQYGLGRFADEIRDIEVVLEDCNGEKGGIDKRCRLQLTLQAGGTLQAAVTDTSCEAALHRASARLRRQMQTAVGERNQHNRRTAVGLAAARVARRRD